MLKRKAKTAAGHRAQKKKEPQAEEGAKKAVFLKGTSTSLIVSTTLKELYALKKPDAIMFSKRNDIHPFTDVKPLEFFSLKNDASLLVFGSHSKKKPHNIVITRTFDHQMLDMVELGITDLRSMEEISGSSVQQGMRPLIIFNGDQWEEKQEYETMRSLFLDLYTGDFEADKINLKGLSHLMVFTLDSSSEKTKVKMGVYNIILKKSGGKTPLVELEEMGPFVDFELRRYTLANEDMLKEAMKAPKLDKEKSQKNISRNEYGEKVGKVWLDPQDLSKMQTRKMKGLKRKAKDGDEDVKMSDDETKSDNEEGSE